MEFAHEPIFQWISQFAYQPGVVYAALIGMMMLSSVGFPLPEEVTLISVGILAFMGAHPQHFPPPYEGAPVVSVHMAAAIALLAVVAADTFIYFMGRIFGRKILYHPRVHKLIPEHLMKRVEEWTHKYGAYACGIFRFTPGIRFPGHLACGMLHFPVWKFIVIDGVAALISVPTQIYLLATYGEPILTKLRQFKLVLLGFLVFLLLYFLIKKWRNKVVEKSS
ncbi:MAG: DedA family protein [Pseudobdellovibrionaceae bacterium]